jgi:hypothetical protein
VVRFPSTNHLFLADADGDPRGYARLAERHVRGAAVQRLADWIARITMPSRTPR